MHRTLALAVLAVALAGCSSARKTSAPDGREAFALDCSGMAFNWGMCYQKARTICPQQAYDIVAANGATDAAVIADPARAFDAKVSSRILVVTCKRGALESSATAEQPGPARSRPGS